MATAVSTRTGRGITTAATAVAVAALLVAAGLVWSAVGGSEGPAGLAVETLAILVPLLTFVGVGLTLLVRRPRNPVGWGLAGYGLGFSLPVLAGEYAGGAVGPMPPFVELAAWYQTWGWALGLLLLALVLLHFPDGDLPSRQWRWLQRLALGLGTLVTLALADLWRVRHALVLNDDRSLYPPFARAVEVVEPFPLVLVVASFVSLVARYRRGGPIVRLQLRWLFAAVAGLAVGLVGFLVSGGPNRAPAVVRFLVLAGMSGIPVAIGIAVLRYRLYELDRIVSRTLTYAVVTVLLAGVYAVGVVGVGAAVPTAANDLVVAATTLVVAALFAPVVRRVRSVVDRHFHRAGYDAQLATARFARQLRDEVNPATVRAALLDAVGASVPASTMFLWIPEGRSRKAR